MKGREHFGYLDGISQPGVKRFSTLNPGQEAVPAGIALCRNSGDPRYSKRPSWSKDGSFLVFRYLEQLVPEFDDFLIKNPIVLDGLPRDEGSALLGARMVGRWKSGAPVDMTPLKDDPVLGADPTRNNNFDFSTDHSQDRCPFAAHIRKTNPRSDEGGLLGGTTRQRIWRRGIPFGPEVTPQERQQAKTIHPRGLAFVCYQSSIDNGFHFIQEAWCNDVAFPIKLLPPVISGYDPIVGMNGSKPRNMFDPKTQGKDLKLPFNFVVPKGGEYFFAPSISTLRDELAVKA
jgi:Dyp-type peroxidase family